MSAWYNAGRVAHKESVVLNSWRAAHGPETCRTRSVQASNDVLTNLTAAGRWRSGWACWLPVTPGNP